MLFRLFMAMLLLSLMQMRMVAVTMMMIAVAGREVAMMAVVVMTEL